MIRRTLSSNSRSRVSSEVRTARPVTKAGPEQLPILAASRHHPRLNARLKSNGNRRAPRRLHVRC